MTYLDDVARGRDNNLNLIRAIAATAVLVSHAYPISLGPGTPEPLHALTGYTLGGTAVAIFFVISGFLITMSFERTRNTKAFIAARILRLFPGLIVSLLLVAFILGPITTTLTTMGYLGNVATYTFLVKNTLLILPQYTLPGVFEDLPYPTVEGSIWTLFYEVACYIGVFLLGIAGLLRRKLAMYVILAALTVIFLMVPSYAEALHPKLRSLITLGFPFAVGTLFYLLRDKLPLSIIGVIVLAGLTWALASTPLYPAMFNIAIGYATFWLAYIPGGAMRAYNKLGDYSYGIYIYAFPLQGFAIWLFGNMTPIQNMLIAFPMTLAISIVSWHLIEAPALEWRHRFKSKPNTAPAA